MNELITIYYCILIYRYQISRTCIGGCNILGFVRLDLYSLALSFALTFQVLGKYAQAIPVSLAQALHIPLC